MHVDFSGEWEHPTHSLKTTEKPSKTSGLLAEGWNNTQILKISIQFSISRGFLCSASSLDSRVNHLVMSSVSCAGSGG